LSAPTFYLFAGPNGAGKSTLYHALKREGHHLGTVEWINADIYEAQFLRHLNDPQDRSRAAQRWAEARRAELMQAGQSFVSETVFSHESKIELIKQARAAGFRVVLFIVGMDRPERLLDRVANRVREGGHHVPPDRILSRYPRTLVFLSQVLPIADMAFLYDSADLEQGTHRMVAAVKQGRPSVLKQPIPSWAQTVLSGIDLTAAQPYIPRA
jgi:predicted ABC-type ATPase